MNISELIKSGQQVQVVINALDLKEATAARGAYHQRRSLFDASVQPWHST